MKITFVQPSDISQERLERSRLYKKFDNPKDQLNADVSLRKLIASALTARTVAKYKLGR